MTTAREIMQSELLMVTELEPASTCLDRLLGVGARHGVVVGADGELAGLLTEHALHVTAPELSALSALVPVGTCEPDDSLESVIRRLLATTQDAIVVVDGQRHPVGLITEAVLVRYAPALLTESARVMVRSWTPVVAISPDATLSEAFEQMTERSIRHLVVVDSGPVLGAISISDLLAAGVTRGADGVVQQLLGEPVHHVPVGALIEVALEKMATHGVGCVPLVDERAHPVGILTRSDVLREILER